jgi:hypothetical protein
MSAVIRDHGIRPYDSAALEANAMARHPECKYARVRNGLTAWFELVEVVQLWIRIEDCDVYQPLHELNYAIEGTEPRRKDLFDHLVGDA